MTWYELLGDVGFAIAVIVIAACVGGIVAVLYSLLRDDLTGQR